MNGTGARNDLSLAVPALTVFLAQIISGFVSFGCLHIHTESFQPWQWLMIITGVVTLVISVVFWCTPFFFCLHLEIYFIGNRFFFPDSPTTAWFLTPDERVKAVLRIKVCLLPL
jgi:hypothetical protein